MKSKFPFFLSTLLFISLSACGILAIEIGENSYRSLPKDDQAFFHPFEAGLVTQKVNNRDDLRIYEVNPPHIKAVSKAHQYLWVHTWRPWCKADHCTNIKYFEDVVSGFPDKRIELMLVSESYDLKQIRGVAQNSPYERPIFVMDGNWYGKILQSNKRQFMEELNNNEAIVAHKDDLWDDYFFKDSVLIFGGGDLNFAILDSLMKE